MFAVLKSSKEKPLLKILLIKTKPNCWEKNFIYHTPYFIFLTQWMNLDSFPQETSWSSVNQNFLLRGPAFAISWTPCFWSQSSDFRWVSDRNAALLLPLAKPTSLNKKNKKWKNNALEIRPSRPKWPLIRPNPDHGPEYKDCDQTFQSDLPDRIDLWSDRTQTMVQTIKTMIRPSRPNWPLIRRKSDHGPDYCVLEPLSRPCNFSLGTQGCALVWVWS